MMAEKRKSSRGDNPKKVDDNTPKIENHAKSMDDDIRELGEIAKAALTLSQDPKAFSAAWEAFLAKDSSRFQAALDLVGLIDRCPQICFFFCRKYCVEICRRFCGEWPFEPLTLEEMIEFARVLNRLVEDGTIRLLVAILDREDDQAWTEEIRRLQLGRFCHQLCHFLCTWRCREVCIDLCPPPPLITRVGSIPVTQIDAQGYGNGPGIPPFHVPAPNPPAGVGDHPFGGSVWLMGMFNMPTATEYLVEYSSTGPAGPYTTIAVPVEGYNLNPSPPPILFWPLTRVPVAGWYSVSGIFDSDGGPNAFGEKTLLYWPTWALPDGLYHVRLRVRDGVITRVSSPQEVQLDNTGPFPLPRPTITLELVTPEGEKKELKCGKVKKGDGLIAVTIHAYDPNFSRVGVTARGNSGLSVAVIDTSMTPLSKTYNGNMADQGYPVPTTFMWDPWSDPNIVPCCYVVYVEIWDRAILNDHWSGGHGNSGWEAIEIGF
jgi:hypothetical protein